MKEESILVSSRDQTTPRKEAKGKNPQWSKRHKHEGPPENGSEPLDSDNEADRSEPPFSEDEDMEGPNLLYLDKRDERLRKKPQSMRYNMPYVRPSTVELYAYRNRGTCQTTKHLRAMHKKYCLMIDRQVG
jgi:hypothetical protein